MFTQYRPSAQIPPPRSPVHVIPSQSAGWRGNPHPPPPRTSDCHSVVIANQCSHWCGNPFSPSPHFGLPHYCHCEPVTDVTGAAIRPPRRRRGTPPSFRASPQAGVAIRSPIIYSSPAKKLLTTSPRRAITIPTYRVGSLLFKSEATPMTYLPPLPLTGRC